MATSLETRIERDFAESFRNLDFPERFGDILFEASLSISSRANRLGQSLIRRSIDSRFSHVYVCVRPGLWMDVKPGTGVSMVSSFKIWKDLISSSKTIHVYRPEFTDQYLSRVVSGTKFAFECYKNPYNLLLMISMRKREKTGAIFEMFYCSQFVVKVLQRAGLLMDLDALRTLPLDLVRACRQNGWPEISNTFFEHIGNEKSVRDYIFAAASPDHNQDEKINQIVEETKGTVIHGRLLNYQYIAQLNEIMERSASEDLARRMLSTIVEDTTSDLIFNNSRNILDNILCKNENEDREDYNYTLADFISSIDRILSGKAMAELNAMIVEKLGADRTKLIAELAKDEEELRKWREGKKHG